jgi:hypothetical protein
MANMFKYLLKVKEMNVCGKIIGLNQFSLIKKPYLYAAATIGAAA